MVYRNPTIIECSTVADELDIIRRQLQSCYDDMPTDRLETVYQVETNLDNLIRTLRGKK